MSQKRFRLSLDLDPITHSRLRRLEKRMNAASVTEVIRRISEDAEEALRIKEARRLSKLK